MIQSSAPGKVILSGEYAVLDGAPAVVMAVDRRAEVTVSHVDSTYSAVSAPGFSDQVARFVVNSSGGRMGLVWSDPDVTYPLVDAVWANVTVDKASLSLTLDTRRFSDGAGQKLGLGSSAALTVALCAALQRSEDVGDVAFGAHANFQGGVGSGADVACSLTGGLIEYTATNKHIRPLAWPEGLHQRLFWSGTSISTTQQISQVLSAGSERRRTPNSVAALSEASSEIAGLWRNGPAQAVVQGTIDFTAVLRSFSSDHDLGVFAAGHAELVDLATKFGIAYKPCGAGGGDMGIALSTDKDALTAFAADAARLATEIHCQRDDAGVQVVVDSLGEEE